MTETPNLPDGENAGALGRPAAAGYTERREGEDFASAVDGLRAAIMREVTLKLMPVVKWLNRLLTRRSV